jgi:hypothetical protein
MAHKAKTPEADRKSASGLPGNYSPRIAGYARGPFLEPVLITPTDYRWRNARTYIVEVLEPVMGPPSPAAIATARELGLERGASFSYEAGKSIVRYRALRVTVGTHMYGYWAIERLGELLPLEEWQGE